MPLSSTDIRRLEEPPPPPPLDPDPDPDPRGNGVGLDPLLPSVAAVGDPLALRSEGTGDTLTLRTTGNRDPGLNSPDPDPDIDIDGLLGVTDKIGGRFIGCLACTLAGESLAEVPHDGLRGFPFGMVRILVAGDTAPDDERCRSLRPLPNPFR
jgi:hypothetical protein